VHLHSFIIFRKLAIFWPNKQSLRPTLFFISVLFSFIVHAQLAQPFQDAYGKYCIDKAGKTVIDLPNAKFSDNTIIRNGFALVENKDGSFNLIDKSGKLVKELN